MNRKEFLQTLSSGSAALVVPLPFNASSMQDVVLYHNYVRGLNHYQYPHIINDLAPGTKLTLRRQAKNTHDTFAVEVLHIGRKLGYLAAYENIVIANLLDQGLTLKTEVIIHQLENSFYERLSIQISIELPVPLLRFLAQCHYRLPADAAWDLYRMGTYGFTTHDRSLASEVIWPPYEKTRQ